ncbi:MAG: hypothetical protein NC320_11300 [Clostridium sp.]|nr:hypothetical protein [Clostridium sp.]
MRVKKILIGILSGIVTMSMAILLFNGSMVTEWQENSAVYAVEENEVDEWLESGFDNTRCTVYSGADDSSFKMSGRTYYQGIVFGNGSYYDSSSVSFNIENVNNVSFTLGHVDNTSKDSTKISIYCDDILIKQYDIE